MPETAITVSIDPRLAGQLMEAAGFEPVDDDDNWAASGEDNPPSVHISDGLPIALKTVAEALS